MRRVTVLITIALLVPSIAHSKIDPSCPSSGNLQKSPSATSVIAGHVTDALGNPLAGKKVELYVTNRNVPTADSAVTDASGFYRICTGENSGSYYDTFDVHVMDTSANRLFATVNQAYTTYANPLGDADFTDESGLPMLYLTNLTISPDAIRPVSSSVTVTFTVTSKAPSNTVFTLTRGYPSTNSVTMTYDAAASSNPLSGGWNVWRATQSIAAGATQKLYWASVKGRIGSVEVAQRDAQPYTIDVTPPVFGPASASVCGPGITANGMSPVSPPGTTNPTPIVRQDVCDPWAPDETGTPSRSALDPTTLQGWRCPAETTPLGSCVPISPVLNDKTIIWQTDQPLSGSYWLRWRIADKAGNVATSPPMLLIVGSGTGQTPVFTALSPGNLGNGSTGGVIIGASFTTPSSIPVIGFRVLDADGQDDLAVGSIRVRVWYGDTTDATTTLVYDYDPALPKTAYDPITRRGGADFDLSSGLFKATGYSLQGKPAGRYVVSASATDRAGNTATVSWHFLLVAAV